MRGMPRRVWLAGAMAMLACLAQSAMAADPSAAGVPQLGKLTPIPVPDGINAISKFAPDGRTGTIVMAWRDNGNAHGHYVYLVLLPLPEGQVSLDKQTGVVAFDGGRGSSLEDVAGASPFDGERVLQTVRFARGQWGGAPATLMLRADLGRSSSGVLADHAPADISIYKLDRSPDGVGAPPDVFRLVARFRPPGRFCNADLALATALRLPLPANYAGPPRPGGCFK